MDVTSEGSYHKGQLESVTCPPVAAPCHLDILGRPGVSTDRVNLFIRKRAVNPFKFLLKDLAETPELSSIEDERDDLE